MFKFSESSFFCCLLNIYLLSQAVIQAALTDGSLYFPISAVEITIPVNIWALTDPVPLLHACSVVEQLSSTRTSQTITYQIAEEPKPPKWLQINSTTGEIFIIPNLRSDKKELTVLIEAHTERAQRAQMKLTIWQSGATLGCHEITKEHCFWKNINYQLYENQQPLLDLGPLVPSFVFLLCPSIDVSYTLSEADLEVTKNTKGSWSIRSTGALDREGKLGSERHLHVTCVPRNSHLNLNATFLMEILDQDDNVPVAQSDTMQIELDSETVQEGYDLAKGYLGFKDLDTIFFNRYKEYVLDDLGLLQTTCKLWNNTNHEFLQTYISCTLTFQRNTTLSHGYSYTARLILTDTNLIPDIAKISNKSEIAITLIIKEKNTSKNIIDISDLDILYHRKDIVISRFAAPFQRLTQPLQSIPEESQLLFEIIDPSNAFAITDKTGIIYVANTSELRSSLWNETKLTVRWKTSLKTINSSISLKVIVSSKDVLCSIDDSQNLSLCAQYESSRECTSSCGFSSSTFCQWRNLNKTITLSQTNYTKHYATCSTNITMCPDGICDELEMKNPYICPQDCISEDNVLGTAYKYLNSKSRGIIYASGTCSCENFWKCICFTHSNRKSIAARTTRTSSKNNGNEDTLSPTVEAIMAQAAICGDRCILAIIVGPIVFLSLLMMLLICLRRRNMLVGVRSKCRFTAQSSGAGREMHVEVDGSPAVDSATQDMNELLTQPDNNINKLHTDLTAKFKPDNKWEIPREKLRIEQILGEGEFGRVLKATARDLPGIQGRVTVAVKTLKADAGNSELVDLLSEYELLKEVSHPNVIRLLGACTSPGGPVYIIIEFAEHGSLRSYLRRSRQLQCSSVIHGETLLLEQENVPPPNPIVPITSRDVLSFAWQISRGMSYLSDMKLVHRDLAARNILVASGLICKVSDFGLSRDVYEDDTYLKRSKGRVPVKWMAIESLADNIYTSKSDVWSFGIVLWELLTLGSSPYPSVAVQNLYQLLRTGYRMRRPENCSQQLFQLMRSCWEENPMQRPTFKEISQQLEGMLQDGIDYLDLNSLMFNNRGYISESSTLPILDGSSTNSDDDDSKASSRECTGKYASIDMNLLPTAPRNIQPSSSSQKCNDEVEEEEEKYELPIPLLLNNRSNANEISLNYLNVEDVSYNKSIT